MKRPTHIKELRGYFAAIAGMVAITAALAPFRETINTTTVALSLLIVVLSVATLFGTYPALVAAGIGVVFFNYFFLPPIFALTISDPQNWVALGAFLITAVIAGQLSAYARRRTDESEMRRREIERLYQELKVAFKQASEAEALRQSEQLKSALLDAVTHDLRTPLTSIKASVTTLLEGSSTRAGRAPNVVIDEVGRDALLEIIDNETDRLDAFIGGIVDLAKLEGGSVDNSRSWHQVSEIIESVLERMRERLNDRRINLRVEDELPAVCVNGVAVEEILYLFLDNAAKYSPSEKPIRITVERSPRDNIEVSVEDQGPGIPAEFREKIFAKFFRRAPEKRHDDITGLGVGLAIARGLAESQNGSVWVTDGQDEYSTRFVFRFPIGDNEVPMDDGSGETNA
ncbi:MAG: DUF4118 domain-containing protein [Acidobacteria bacterium]|nr:DUF4118 domain-containing protein [Acidobacteriota bacterium]MCO5334417.1 DUF4118 domain-containing protein [Pyrinomonadaceae bacterium]